MSLNSELSLLESLLAEAGFTITTVSERPGLLGEDEARVVWAVTYPTVDTLLTGWHEEQSWFVNFVGDRVAPEKTWELYLVLASDEPALEGAVAQLDALRSDTAFTRKIVVTGLGTSSPARVRDHLAPLRPLDLDVAMKVPDAIALLEDKARDESRVDVMDTLDRYRANRPLFGDNE